jgi:hypothetical protein
MAIGRSSIPQQITKVPSKKRKTKRKVNRRIKNGSKRVYMTGKPTGQGFGAARKGPQVKGAEQDVVVDYEPGKIVEYND